MSKSVYVRVVHDLELLRYVLRCAIPLGLIKYIVIVITVKKCKRVDDTWRGTSQTRKTHYTELVKCGDRYMSLRMTLYPYPYT